MVNITVTDTADSSAFLSSMVVYFILRLENAIGNVTDLCAVSMSDYTLHTITTKLAVGSYRFRQFKNFIPISGYVSVQVVSQSEGSLVTITQIKFKTLVFHCTRIYPTAAAFSQHSYSCHFSQDICCFLVVVFQ